MEANKMDGRSMDLRQCYADRLARLFPEAVCEGRVDLEQLALILGQEQETAPPEERYRFTWAGRREAIRAARTPSTGALRPDRPGSCDWDTTQNLYIEGDNLEVLKLLQKSYFEQVKMIYIDPPYNTGKDFVYRDDYRDSLKNYFELTQQTDSDGNRLTSNAETSGRYHTDWLNMMYPRLRLARNLLRDDGVIFISIDDNEVHNLRKICDEIFGEDNFLANLVWQKKTGASDAKAIATITESILVYCRDYNAIDNTFTRNTESYDLTRYGYTDKFVEHRGPYYIDNLDRGGLQYSDSLNYGIKCPDGTITFPNGRTEYKNDGWIWKWSKTKVEWALENSFLEFRKSKSKESGWSVCYKNYLLVDNEGNRIERGAPHKNLITDVLNANAASTMKSLFGTNRYFEYSKPTELIENLMKKVVTDNSIILDFFSGSATTAHAVMQLNAEDGGRRRFIMVQLPEPTPGDSEARRAGYETISQIGMERIRRAGAKIRAEHPGIAAGDLDTGFRLFRLDTSNIRAWMTETEREELQHRLTMPEQRPQAVAEIEQRLFDCEDNLVPGRSEQDLLCELMLKMGLDLSTRVERHTGASGRDIYVAGGGALMVCLGDGITCDIAGDLIALHRRLAPEVCHFIFRDNGFADDRAKTNTLESLKSAGLPAGSFLTV